MKRGEQPRRGERPLQDEHVERLIDEALEETFPASDPPSPAIGIRPGNGGENRRKGNDA